MNEEFVDKIKSVGVIGKYVGKPKVTFVPHEDDGKAAGYFTEHADGRIDARVKARTGHSGTKIPRPGGSSE